MEKVELKKLESVRELVGVVHASEKPVVIYDNEDEALVAMSPAVFERFLIDGALISADDSTTYRL